MGPYRLAPLFGDNMVLQQRSHVPIWGLGTPGTQIRVKPSWGTAVSALVKSDSTWMLSLTTPKAGGPYKLDIGHDDTTLHLKNVMLGEVWLCSGQSNMEMPLAGWPPNDTVMNSRDEIAHSSLPDIRMFTVRKTFSAKPETACSGGWVQSSPEASGEFSATAYFFGKRLYETLHVPIGLIHSSWGGTRIESWIRSQYLSTLPGYDTTLQRVQECVAGQQKMMDWLHQFPRIDMSSRKGEGRWVGLVLQDEECPSRSYNDSSWRIMKLPTVWERTEVGNFDGVVWFRRQLKVPSDWVHKDLILELGPVDDIDVTYVNGTRVGGHEGQGQWNVPRVYQVPAEIVDSTIVQIAVRVVDYQGGGGIYGNPRSMVLHPLQSADSLSLAGDWRYAPVAEYLDDVLCVFGPSGNQYETRPRLPIDLSADTPTSLFNGMISPLVPYSIRGAIWYQGEANTDNAAQYKKLLPLLVQNWRNDFKVKGFPFYFVQIAPYDYGTTTHSEFLREVQTATLGVPNTGMAVTLDIGNPKNIHPTNKQEVGGRLAQWALAKTYKKNVPYSGPMYKSMKKLKRRLELSFEHAERGLVLIGGMLGNEFQIAGSDRMFRSAVVQVHGSKLIVTNPDIANPEAVRYAFTNTSTATLFNMDGLPASSFRTDDWK